MASQAPRSATAVPDLAPEREVRWPQRAKFQLANGLSVILVESHTVPKFHGELFFRSGNAAAANRGIALAEMTATMLRTGTTHSTSRQIEERLRGLGADLSVNAGQDTSAISFAGLSDHRLAIASQPSQKTMEALPSTRPRPESPIRSPSQLKALQTGTRPLLSNRVRAKRYPRLNFASWLCSGQSL